MRHRRIIIIASILLIGISATGIAYQSWKEAEKVRKEAEEVRLKELQEKEMEPFNIEFTFIEQTSFDPEWFYGYVYRTDSPITWWEHAHGQHILDMATETYHLKPSKEFDFTEHNLLFTFGRKIHEIECKKAPHYGETLYSMTITFENEIQKDVAYIYSIEKRNYVPSGLYSPCYIMRNEKREFLARNVYNINEVDEEKEWKLMNGEGK